jgi:leucyl-tRNA synthetase
VMFAGPVEAPFAWNSDSLVAMKRWLTRIHNLYTTHHAWTTDVYDQELFNSYQKLVHEVTNYYEKLKFNRVITKLMIFINECYQKTTFNREHALGILQLLYPLAPHLTCELWQQMKPKTFLFEFPWPSNLNNPQFLSEKISLIVQVNGKLFFTIFGKKSWTKNEWLVQVENHFKYQKTPQLTTSKKIWVDHIDLKQMLILNFVTN